jgi:hypothetical protein
MISDATQRISRYLAIRCIEGLDDFGRLAYGDGVTVDDVIAGVEDSVTNLANDALKLNIALAECVSTPV